MDASNPYFLVITAMVLVVFAIETIATLLNLRALQPELPADFSDVYDAENYRKSQDYTREESRFDLWASSSRLAVLLAFWWCGGFRWLHEFTAALTESDILRGLFCVSFLYVGSWLLGLPFEIYSTFVLEQKYGFNRTTRQTFIADQIKSMGLAAVIGLPLMAFLFWLFGKYPGAWVWAWIAVTALTILLTFLVPVLILPLFNKFTPLPDGELKSEITAMAQRCGFPFKEISIMDGSRRSARSNAFFTGFGANKKIALFDTLVAKHTVPELVAVLAHEIGHFKKNHIVQRLALSVLQIGLLFFLLGQALTAPRLYEAFGIVGQKPIHLGFVFFLVLYQPVQFLISVFLSLWSRKHEFEADAYASDAMGGPQSLISGLKKLAADNLSNVTPHPFYVFLNYSHPPMRERLSALAKLAQRNSTPSAQRHSDEC